MGSLSERRQISRSPEVVADCLKDMTRFPQWLPETWGAYEPITQTLVGKGARSYFTLPALGLTIPSELEITEVMPERVRWAIAAPPLELILLFNLSPEGEGTAVHLEVASRISRLPPWRLRTQARVRLFQERDIKAITGGILDSLVREAESQPEIEAPEAEPAAPARPDGFRLAAPLEELPPGTGRAVEAFGTTIAVFNIDGTLHAIDNDCPHREGPLSQGQLDGPIVTCPLHRWRFDVTDGTCLDNPHHPTRSWPVKVEDGAVYVGPRS